MIGDYDTAGVNKSIVIWLIYGEIVLIFMPTLGDYAGYTKQDLSKQSLPLATIR